MAYFGITPDDIRKKLNAQDIAQAFQIGSGAGKIPVAQVEEIIEQYEQKIISNLPYKYQELIEKISGNILTDDAFGGEVEFQLQIMPVSNVVLYKNYPVTMRRYTNRKNVDRLPTSKYSFTAEGKITLVDALKTRETLIADYNHTGLVRCHQLRLILLNYVAAELLKQIANSSPNSIEKAASWEESARRDLFGMTSGYDTYDGGGKKGIYFFDRLKLVAELETRSSKQIVGLGDPTYGLL